MRSFLVLALVGTLGFLVGCGGSGTPVGVPVTIGLTPTSASVNAGKTLNIVLSTDSSGKGVTWALSPSSGLGGLSKQTTTSATYNAPSSVTKSSLVTVTATSIASSSVTASVQITVLPAGAANNIQPIHVNGGPLANYANGVFTSVEICVPGKNNCQTIDDILVDTGSFGLRILASQITVPLPVFTDQSGVNTLNNCINFLDGSFLWGNVAQADVVMAGEVASATSIQLIATPTTYSIPLVCSTNGTGTNEDTQQTLGANGILGVGPEPFDCGTICDLNAGGSPPEPFYYLCSSSSGCSPTFVSCGTLCGDSVPNQQLTNAVFNFAADNNGVILELPALPASGVTATVDGNMIFGIGTQSNNGLSTATVFTLDANDNFTTVFSGQTLTGSFIDSGSNALFFPNGIESGFPGNTIPTCASPEQSFFCPTSLTKFSATNQGATQGSSNVSFSVDNATNLFSQNPTDFAFSTLAGPLGSGACTNGNGACSFDWGLPFFYNRHVFTAIHGATPPTGVPAGPFFAY